MAAEAAVGRRICAHLENLVGDAIFKPKKFYEILVTSKRLNRADAPGAWTGVFIETGKQIRGSTCGSRSAAVFPRFDARRTISRSGIGECVEISGEDGLRGQAA